MAASIRARLSFSLLVLPFIAFVATARLGAQATIAITGVITDASGGVLPGATVEVQAAGRRLAAFRQRLDHQPALPPSGRAGCHLEPCQKVMVS